jgi:glycerol kinase
MIQYSLLLDIGGTDIKIGVGISGGLSTIYYERYRMPSFISPHQKEIDPSLILSQVKSALFDCIGMMGKPNEILVAGQTASWILTTESGRPITNVISWQSNAEVDTVLNSKIYGSDYELQKNTLLHNGNENSEGAPWRSLPSTILKSGLHTGVLLYHSLISWIVWELTDHVNHVIHLTDAAASGMVRIPECEWMGNFQMDGVSVSFPLILDEIRPAGNLSGTEVKVYIALADQQVSLLGVDLSQSEFAINAGTGGQVACLVPEIIATPGKIRPYFSGNFLVTYTHIPSGRFLEKFLRCIDDQSMKGLDWSWLLERGELEMFDSTSTHSLGWNFDTFLEDLEFSDENYELVADKFVAELVKGFICKLEAMGFTKGDPVVLAGGVATNLKILREVLIKRFEADLRDSETEESTLAGLVKISGLIKD